MTKLTDQQLYEEFEGLAGSEADTYGYKAGEGTSLQEKWQLFTAFQDETSVRPITVTIRSEDKVGAGVVSGFIAIQALKQAVDLDEDGYMELLAQNPDTLATPTVEDQTKWRYVKDAYMLGTNDSLFLYTDEFQAQLVDAIPNNIMPNTRTALIAAASRDGSRSEEMQGIQTEEDDLRSAEEWRITNKPGSPSLYL